MAGAKQHKLLIYGGGAAAAFAAYEFVYKPWKLSQDAALLGSTSMFPSLGPSSMLSTPSVTNWGGAAPGGVQGSIVDPRVTPGGDVGAAMYKKTWTQAYATDRLAKIKAGIANSKAGIAQLQAQTVNPAASGIANAQLILQQTMRARDNAVQQAANARAAGDQNGAAIWNAAVNAHNQDIAELNARISAAQTAPDNSSGIAAYQGALAALIAEYNALTGMTIS